MPKKNQANTSWLQVIESTPPKFHCPVIEEDLTGPCGIHQCWLWADNPKVYNCAGAFGSMKAANSEERLMATSTAQREKRGTLRSAADGKMSFYDMAYLFSYSRQRIEGYVNTGKSTIETSAPVFSMVGGTSGDKTKPQRRLGSPYLFTKTSPTSYIDPENVEEVTRVCVCCESVIDPDDNEAVIAVLDRAEVAWCSRVCTKELTIDGYLVSNRYKRHYSSVALGKDPVDERSRVREITTDRFEALTKLATEQGYQ